MGEIQASMHSTSNQLVEIANGCMTMLTTPVAAGVVKMVMIAILALEHLDHSSSSSDGILECSLVRMVRI
jgi:hypothetical protein